MAKVAAKHTLDETLDMIHTHLTELRQTEALEAQIHDMVVAKRHRLDGLMGDFLRLAAEPVPVAEPVPMAAAPGGVAPVVAEAQALPEDSTMSGTILPLTTVPAIGAPRDLLQSNGKLRSSGNLSTAAPANAALPTPSAQQVLDSLNRLMSGLKEISVKQGNAPLA